MIESLCWLLVDAGNLLLVELLSAQPADVHQQGVSQFDRWADVIDLWCSHDSEATGEAASDLARVHDAFEPITACSSSQLVGRTSADSLQHYWWPFLIDDTSNCGGICHAIKFVILLNFASNPLKCFLRSTAKALLAKLCPLMAGARRSSSRKSKTQLFTLEAL